MSRMIHLLGLLVVLTGSSHARAVLIDFEESITQPGTVQTQYCNNPTTNKGVEFLTTGRIYEPTVATNSPTHALTNAWPGDEFGETKVVEISFTSGQSQVGVKVGLDRAYYYPMTAEMHAYSQPDPDDGGYIGYDTVYLGQGPTSITNALSVSSGSANIRSVVVFIEGSSPGAYAYEVIDDLMFSSVGPTCTSDNTPPTVQILKPVAGAPTTHNPAIEVEYTVYDGDTGIAAIQVSFLDGSGTDVGGSFYACGGSTAQPCTLSDGPSFTHHGNYHTYLPEDTRQIRVKAWDFAGLTDEATRDVDFVSPGPNMNLWAQALEVTQGTQPWLPENTQHRLAGDIAPLFIYPNSATTSTAVPFAIGRTTVVRLFAGVENTTGDISVVGAQASLRCNNCLNGPVKIKPTNLPPEFASEIRVSPTDTLDTKRRSTTLSWLFILPDEWTAQGVIELEGVVMPPLGASECSGCTDAANRMRVSGIRFYDVDKVTEGVRVYRIHLTGETPAEATDAQMDSTVEEFVKRYPLDETTVPTTYDVCKYTPTTNGGCGEPIQKLQKCNQGKSAVNAVYGVITDWCSGLGGGGYGYGRLNMGPFIMAEEVGHAIGMSHAGPPPGHAAECAASSGGCESDSPYPHGRIGAFGFDVLSQPMAVIAEDQLACHTAGVCDNGLNENGNTTGPPNFRPIVDEECFGAPGVADLANFPHDYMSYGPCFQWVSPRSWIRSLNAFADKTFPYPTTSRESLYGEVDCLSDEAIYTATTFGTSWLERNYIMITGSFGDKTGWGLQQAYEVEHPVGTDDEPEEGTHRIELRDAGGEPLFTRHLTPLGGHVEPDDPNVDPGIPQSPSFVALLPLPDGVATIVLMMGEETLSELTRSENAPTVEILSPTADGLEGQPDDPHIRWTAHDDDGDELSYLIQYTPGEPQRENGDWRTIAVDVVGEELSISLDELPGGEQAMVRVLATDGFNTGVADSPPFYVPNNPPRVRILAPPSGTTILEGDPLDLRGTAGDREDGLIEPEYLAWYSQQDGLLGTGRTLSTDSLTPGGHEIELQAEDSHGQVSVDYTAVLVLERTNRQPIADAGADQVLPLGPGAQLDGSGSNDADGDLLSFHWSVINQPPGSNASLDNAFAAQPSLFPDGAGVYDIQLIVHDGEVASRADTTSVTITSASDCVDAIPVGAGSYPFSTTGATSDGPLLPEECDEGYGLGFGQDTWFCFLPDVTGTVTASTCNTADFDTRLAAYRGCQCPMTNELLLACNDDGDDCTGYTSILTFYAVAGEEYLIRVGGFDSAAGLGELTLVNAACPGDFVGDGVVALNDLASFVGCMMGPDTDLPHTCYFADLDSDRDGDLHDFARLQNNFGECP